MSNYVDGFVFPISTTYLKDYQRIAEKVALIWKEYGALAYFEYVGDDLELEGTLSFPKLLETKNDESIIFGWVVFSSREDRDIANKKVPNDPRMKELVDPLVNSSKLIFDASRMAYGGFQKLVSL